MTGTDTAIPLRRRLLYLYFHVKFWGQWLLYRLGIRRRGAPLPHRVKRAVVRAYARRYGARVLVETGTYMGDMLAAMARSFDALYSIELSEAYHAKAKARFAGKPHVHLRQGDSAVELAKVVAALQQRALFWLDAHYSGGLTARGDLDTPIVQELREILSRNPARHVVLVDDARCFDGSNGYPAMEALRELVRSFDPSYSVDVADDIIRITPPR